MAYGGSFSTALTSYARLATDWYNDGQNIAGNYTTVTANTYIIFDPVSYGSGGGRTATISINGSAGTYSFNLGDWSGGRTILVGSRTINVPHNNDGSKSVAISSAVRVELTLSGAYFGTVSVSGTATLPTIPRASSISSLTPTVDVNGTNSVSIGITRAVSTFTHQVEFHLSPTYKEIITGVATSASFVIPQDWLNGIPNSVSGTVTAYVTTYSGSTKIGNTAVKTFTITVPSNVVPTIASVTSAIIRNDVPAAWAVYVQNHSFAKITVNGAAGVFSSTIKSYKIETVGGTWDTATVDAELIRSGSVTFTGTVTDSRGRTASKSVTITVQEYREPGFSSVDLERGTAAGVANNEGTYGRLLAAFFFSSVAGKNSVVRKIEYRRLGLTPWSAGGSFNTGAVQAFGGGTISVNNTYEVRLTLTDGLSSAEWVGNINTSFNTVDYKKGGRGIAFGKAAEHEGLFEVDFEARFNKLVEIEELLLRGAPVEPVGIVNAFAGAAAPQGWLLCDGAEVSRTAYAALFAVCGVLYGAGNGSSTFNLPDLRGRVPTGKDATADFNALGKSGGAKTHKLSEAELPSHRHAAVAGFNFQLAKPAAGRTYVGQGGPLWALASPTLDNISTSSVTDFAGGDGAHPNLAPYLTLNFIIKAA